jgi:hypothetical protein
MVKEDAAIVTKASRGGGVAELIGRLVVDDLADAAAAVAHQRVALVRKPDGSVIELHPFSGNLLIAGTSGGGKSTLATGLLERFAECGFQFCVIDPEGDYAGLEGAVTVGDAKTPPSMREALELLEGPGRSVVVDLTGLELAERPRAFADLAPELSKLRARTARPHWLLIEEAHHLLPAGLGTAAASLPRELAASIVVTVRPDHVAQPALEAVQLVLMVGADAATVLRSFCRCMGEATPQIDDKPLARGEALLWDRRSVTVRRVGTIPPRAEHLRHSRKYAEGELDEDKSFYFRGPEGSLNLRAQNLVLFLQLAEGVDDASWLYHLRAGDYSRWIRDAINDQELAAEIGGIEADESLSASESRKRVKGVIECRYTSPA